MHVRRLLGSTPKLYMNTVNNQAKPCKICGIGAGILGVPTCAVLAMKCPEMQVCVVDEDQDLINRWNSEYLPIDEPGLRDVLKKCIGVNLTISADVDRHLSDADIILICVNTPAKSLGVGRGRAADLSSIEKVARLIARTSQSSAITVVLSTVPIGATDHISQILHANGDGASEFVVLSNPHFISEGQVMHDLLQPDHVILGGDLQSNRSLHAINLLKQIYTRWVPDQKIVTVSTRSAEVSKLVTNAFLAQRVSSVNALSGLCEETAADVRQVAEAVGRDVRVGPYFLQASLGFGGNTLPKDVRHLVYMCESLNLPVVANYWGSVLAVNDYQVSRFFRKITAHYCETLGDKRIAIFGCTFKAGTPDVCDSPAIKICSRLIKERATVTIYDPLARKDETFDAVSGQLGGTPVGDQLIWCSSPAEAAAGADGIVICTNLEEFATLDYANMYESMRKPASLFDGRLVVDHRHLMKIGFRVEAVGVSLQ
ncbi:hypothetical protein AAHC03_05751 [Spirometra sp. Aus1]